MPRQTREWTQKEVAEMIGKVAPAPAITKELALAYGTYHETGAFNSQGRCRAWRGNGEAKTWKRTPKRFRVPVKHGLYDYGYVADYNAASFHTDETCPFVSAETRATCRRARIAGQIADRYREIFNHDIHVGLIEYDREGLGWWRHVATGEPYYITRDMMSSWWVITAMADKIDEIITQEDKEGYHAVGV